MPIAELFLSSILRNLLSQLGSTLLAEYARINGISQKLNNWGRLLLMVQDVMDSAGDRQIDGDPAVDQWLDDLREVAYDMEDLLDEFSIEAQRNALMVGTRSAKLPSFLIACCSKMNPHTLLSDHHMANEIDGVDRRLEEVFQRKALLGLAEKSKAPSSPNSNNPRFTTTSLPEPTFVGREKQIEVLLSRLAGSDLADDSVRPFAVVSIVGMGGLGKTTLAQHLYNHESVSQAFAVRAWTCVSDAFDSIAITRSILKSVGPSVSCHENDLNWLQNSLKEQLSKKKFLIVLDDVWNENYHELEYLLKPFYSGSRGSRVLLTTRNLEVAKLAGDRDPRELDLLSTGECLSLLAFHAIGDGSFERHPHLKDIAVRLAGKCRGLPLAVKTIGGLLRFESHDEKWKDVLDHDIWKREGEGHNIPPALKLSYLHLPIHLKRCFAACALFPKDYGFDMDELIHLWIVQGVLQKGSRKTFREVGIEYSRQLEARSLLQKTGDEKLRYCMHDLINDLAKSIVGFTYYSSDESRGPSDEVSLGKVRHAAFVTELRGRCLASKFDVYHSMKKLRAFIPFQISNPEYQNVFVSKKVIHDLVRNLKYLRVLSLRWFNISKVPDHIGKLKLLRSINLSYTDVEVLPESICDLVGLESLLLRGCSQLKKLPRNVHKLTKLIHLDITGADNLKEMPPYIGRLTNLEILSRFVVSKGTGHGLKELGPLKALGQELHIHNLIEVDDVGDARVANLREKEGISYLSFDWGADLEGISSDNERQSILLDNLQPPRKIERLGILRYGGKEFSSWFGNPCMDSLTDITLKDCKNVVSLPPLGKLPSLKRLGISRLDALSRIGDEFYGTERPFRSLLSLGFHNMPTWEEWSSRGDYGDNEQPFPCVRKLSLENCPLLKRGLPGRLDTLSELVIQDCPLLETPGDSLSLPSLRERRIKSCNDALLKYLVDVTSMTKMRISELPELVYFDRKFSTSWVSLEAIMISSCPQFKSFVEGNFRNQELRKLKFLGIESCDNLEKLPDDLCWLPSVNELWVSGCRKLSAFPSTGLPPTLSKLSVSNCPNLEKLPNDLYCHPSLYELWVSGCRKLSAFPSAGLPPALSKLRVSDCDNLEKLPDDLYCHPSMYELWVSGCRKLSAFPSGGLPPTLGKLRVSSCSAALHTSHFLSTRLPQALEELILDNLEELTSLNDLILGAHCSRSLHRLFISGCTSLTTLPECLRHLSSLSKLGVEDCPVLELDRFPDLPCSLSTFALAGCPKVTSLPHNMRNLTSLKGLLVKDCAGITCFPRGGFPPCLECLGVYNCKKLNQPLEEWSLSGLGALRVFRFGGAMECVDEMASFPSSPDGNHAWRGALPSSLLKLEILGMKKAEGLAGGLHAHLTSLRELRIIGCQKMRFLPDEGLPDSLQEIEIAGCPLLMERCREEDKGEYWPLLQLIPKVSLTECCSFF